MKILFVIENLAGGGAEKVLTTLIKRIDKKKYDITVLSIVKTGVHVKEIENECKLKCILPDYNSIRNPIKKMAYKLKYKKVYREPIEEVYKKYIHEEYDIEIAFVEGFVTKLVAASNNKNSKKYAWVHTDMMNNPFADNYYNSLEDEIDCYNSYDRIFAVSKNVKEAFEEKFKIMNKVSIQFNPVDSDEILYKAKLSEPDLICSYDGLKIISVGRLEEPKGYDRLLMAVSKFKEKNIKFKVFILGTGSQKERFEEYIINNGIEEYVVLCGFQENPYPWIKNADLFICSSRAEGFSTVATEAVILGKPVYTTDCSGMDELISDSDCGKIFDNSQEGIEKMLEEVLLNQELIKEYSKAAQKRGLFFNIDNRISEIEEILDN